MKRETKPPTRATTERLMSMTDEVWARHANPWSGWSRMSVPPLFAIAVWSRVWLGWWCLVPVALVVFWTWFNPRAFGKPANLANWMSQGVLGERIFLARRSTPIPPHHRRVPLILACVSGIGLVPAAWGLWALEIWPTLTGLVITMGGKLWFLDRMVWLASDQKSATKRRDRDQSRSSSVSG